MSKLKSLQKATRASRRAAFIRLWKRGKGWSMAEIGAAQKPPVSRQRVFQVIYRLGGKKK
jgi:hypothetical protein